MKFWDEYWFYDYNALCSQMINKEMRSMPNVSPPANIEKIWELLTCVGTNSSLGCLYPKDGLWYWIQFSSEPDEAQAHTYCCRLDQRTVSPLVESFTSTTVISARICLAYLFHLTAGFRKNEPGKEQCFRNTPSPVIRKKCSNYSFCKNHSLCQYIFKCELRKLDLEKAYTCECRKIL